MSGVCELRKVGVTAELTRCRQLTRIRVGGIDVLLRDVVISNCQDLYLGRMVLVLGKGSVN